MSVNKIPPRAIIQNRDIMNFTGKSLRSVQRMVCKVRRVYNKGIYDNITYIEFCAVFKFDEEVVRRYMQP
jgi:hypothetical protein